MPTMFETTIWHVYNFGYAHTPQNVLYTYTRPLAFSHEHISMCIITYILFYMYFLFFFLFSGGLDCIATPRLIVCNKYNTPLTHRRQYYVPLMINSMFGRRIYTDGSMSFLLLYFVFFSPVNAACYILKYKIATTTTHKFYSISVQ